MAEHHPPQTFDPSLEAPMEVTTIERIELGPNFPKISPCDEALHTSYRGISAANFAQWRHKFDEKVAMHPSRKLKTRLELARIYNLLDDWDNMTHAQRRDVSCSATLWRDKYTCLRDGVLAVSKTNQICLPREDLYEYLVREHLEGNHCKETGTFNRAKRKYYHLTKEVCGYIADVCPECLRAKDIKKPRAGHMPMITQGANVRGQVDLIDLQSLDHPTYRWLLNYQDHGVKDVYLEALRSKTMIEVAYALVNIFKVIGVPMILHSDNGAEFSAIANRVEISNDDLDELIVHIKDLWPGAIMVKGRPRHSESQGSVERSNRLVQRRLGAWMRTNDNTDWPLALPFVQWGINTDNHSGTRAIPYQLRFGQLPRCGLSTAPVSIEMQQRLRTEQELLDRLPEQLRAEITAPPLNPLQMTLGITDAPTQPVASPTSPAPATSPVVAPELSAPEPAPATSPVVAPELSAPVSAPAASPVVAPELSAPAPAPAASITNAPIQPAPGLSAPVSAPATSPVTVPVTVDSVIIPDIGVSPKRRRLQAQACRNLQKQGKKMQRRAANTQGGYLNLPLGLVVYHRKGQYERAKAADTPTMLVMVVAQPGAHVYTVATKAGVLVNNINKTYLTVPSEEISPAEVNLDGVLEEFNAGHLPKLSSREFAASDSIVGGAGHVRCSCKKGACTNCKCRKAGRYCHSSCGCAKTARCRNRQP